MPPCFQWVNPAFALHIQDWPVLADKSYSSSVTIKSLEPPVPGVVEKVRRTLEEEILRGTLDPGSRVNADDVARRMGISHIPVREALRALEAEGWVLHRPHQGASVRQRELTELVDLFEARAVIEPNAVRLAAQRRTNEDLQALRGILAEQEAAAEPEALARINFDFHVALAAAAHNSTLLSVVISLSKRVRFYFLPTATVRKADSLADHRELYALLERRDSEGAQALLREHIDSTRIDACAGLSQGAAR